MFKAALKTTGKFHRKMSDIVSRIDREGTQAVKSLSEQIHHSVMVEMDSTVKRSLRDRPGDLPASIQPHLRDYLDNTREMIAKPYKMHGIVRGGWGKISYMDKLYPAWQAHMATDSTGKAQPFGPPRRNTKKPLWRIIQDGRGAGATAVAVYPSYTGRIVWLMWTEKSGAGVRLRFHNSRIRPLVIPPMPPRPFVALGIRKTSANSGGFARMLMIDEYFAEHVSRNVLPGNWKKAHNAKYTRRGGGTSGG